MTLSMVLKNVFSKYVLECKIPFKRFNNLQILLNSIIEIDKISLYLHKSAEIIISKHLSFNIFTRINGKNETSVANVVNSDFFLFDYQGEGRGGGAVGLSVRTASGKMGVRIPTATYLNRENRK